MISRSDLDEKLKEINKVYREINVAVKKILDNLYKLEDILIREGPKMNININDHCAVLEEIAIGAIYVAYGFFHDFFHTLIGTKIGLHDNEDFKKRCCGCSRRRNEKSDISNDLHFSRGEK